MVAKQDSTKRTPLMLGYDGADEHLALKAFYNRREEQGLENSVELMKLLPMTTQVDRSGGLGVSGDPKTNLGPKPK